MFRPFTKVNIIHNYRICTIEWMKDQIILILLIWLSDSRAEQIWVQPYTARFNSNLFNSIHVNWSWNNALDCHSMLMHIWCKRFIDMRIKDFCDNSGTWRSCIKKQSSTSNTHLCHMLHNSPLTPVFIILSCFVWNGSLKTEENFHDFYRDVRGFLIYNFRTMAKHALSE